jgi:hypothetical protein
MCSLSTSGSHLFGPGLSFQALDHHPDSDELLLAYLTASAQRDDAPMLYSKWAKVLKRLSGSCLLWREYIRLRKGQYSSFSVSDVRAVYVQALGAMVQERNRVRREGAGEEKVGDFCCSVCLCECKPLVFWIMSRICKSG